MRSSTRLGNVLTKIIPLANSISYTQGSLFSISIVVDYSYSLPFVSQPSVGIAALAIARVRSFSKLREGWDGYGATSIKSATIENAANFLDGIHLPPLLGTPFVAPHPNGTITFEWESPFGEAYLEIGQTRYSFYVKPIVGKAIFLEGKTDSPEIYPMAKSIEAILLPIQSSSSSINPAARVNGPTA